MFAAGVPFPQGKSWVTNVMRDPHVRMKFGNNLYDCILSPVTDPDERAAVLGPRANAKPSTYGLKRDQWSGIASVSRGVRVRAPQYNFTANCSSKL